MFETIPGLLTCALTNSYWFLSYSDLKTVQFLTKMGDNSETIEALKTNLNTKPLLTSKTVLKFEKDGVRQTQDNV